VKDNYKNKKEKELQQMLLEKRNELRNFRFKITKGKTKNVKVGRELKREMARILTKINEHGKQKG